VENAEISKSRDDMISITKDENSVEILIDEKKESATLKICDCRIHYLKVKEKNGKLKIYSEREFHWVNRFLFKRDFP